MTFFFDCGATKCDCIVLDGQGRYLRHYTGRGFNASYAADAEIAGVLTRLHDAAGDADHILFSGAGCGANGNRVRTQLSNIFTASEITVESDLAGAARLLCDGQPALVAILGTGASCCRYDGGAIVEQAPSLGWLLGDEGSGTHIGKLFITSYLRGELPTATAAALEQELHADRAAVIARIYREPQPNLFFSSLAKFIQKESGKPAVAQILGRAFDDFCERQVLPVAGARPLPLHLMGSIAQHFQSQLQAAAARHGLAIGHVAGSPLQLLQNRH